jgi:ATP-dependent Clp protease ATP-binding subunit ClpA
LSSEKVALTEPPAEDYGLLNVELQEALKLEEKQYHSLSRQLLKDLKSSIVQRADRLLFASDNPISSPNLEVLSLADIQRERLCRRFDLMDVYYTGELKDLSLTRISSYLFSEWFAAKSSKKTSKNLKPSLASKSRLLGNFFVFPGFVFEGYLEEVRKSCQDSGLSYESAYDFFEEDSSKQKIDLDQFTELARTQSAIFVDFFSKMKPLLRKGFIASLLKTAFPIQERETELIKLVLGFYSQQRTQLFLSYIKDHTKLREARTQGGPGIRGVVSDGDINELLGEMTGIPVNSISVDESSKLLELESSLHKRVIGQETAIRAIAKALRRSRLGIQNPNRPIGSFLFCGPTGVGKTEVTKALSERIFGSEKQMIRFDMSEFMEKFTVSRLIGSPPGYVGYEDGGQLTDAVRKKPYSVVLFDEVEKAHPDVLNILLQILEDGRLTDSEKRLIHFDNTIVILTSNAAASEIQEILQEEMSKKQKDSLESEGSSKETFKRKVSAQNQGEYLETHSNLKEFLDSPIQENFLKDLKKKILESLQTIPENLRADYQDFSSDTLLPQSSSKSSKQKPQEREALLKEKVMEKLTTIFLPEFLNRLDDIIVFEPLKPEELRKICTVMIDQLTERVKKKNIFITVDDAVKNKLAQEGYDPMFGARPLRRLVTKYIEDLLSDSFLEYTTKTGSNSGQFFVHVQLNENNEIISTFDSKASLKEKNF